jgi:hypothetical protein
MGTYIEKFRELLGNLTIELKTISSQAERSEGSTTISGMRVQLSSWKCGTPEKVMI